MHGVLRIVTMYNVQMASEYVPVGYKMNTIWVKSAGHIEKVLKHLKFVTLMNGSQNQMLVPTLDWTDFFATKRKRIQVIKNFHHLLQKYLPYKRFRENASRLAASGTTEHLEQPIFNRKRAWSTCWWAWLEIFVRMRAHFYTILDPPL